MPTYEYVCTACQNAWEEIQKISEDPVQVCPKCGEATAKRQISGGNFILKGGGWYADAYSGSSNKKSGSGEGKSEASAPAAGSTAPAAPATKTESAAPAPAAATPSSTPAKSESK